jgi:hypothetical protein
LESIIPGFGEDSEMTVLPTIPPEMITYREPEINSKLRTVLLRIVGYFSTHRDIQGKFLMG